MDLYRLLDSGIDQQFFFSHYSIAQALGMAVAGAKGSTALGWAAKEERPVEFTADHPFIVQIIDRRTGMIHFMGRVTRPGIET